MYGTIYVIVGLICFFLVYGGLWLFDPETAKREGWKDVAKVLCLCLYVWPICVGLVIAVLVKQGLDTLAAWCRL